MHVLSKCVNDYKSLKNTIKDLELKLIGFEDEIKAYMGEQEEIIVDGNVIRWKAITQKRFDVKEFKNQHSTLYEDFLKQTEIRRFTVT